MTIPTTVRGAMAASIACSIVGKGFLARATPVTRRASSNPTLIHAWRVVGGPACIGGAAESFTGTK
jgi:hypothetical protein